MILVVGATGSLGGMITQQLLKHGKSVRILVRPSSNYKSLVDMGAQPVIGDLKDRASLDKACDGITTVITTANSAQRGGEDNVETVDLNGNHSLIDAAKAAGVKHFIFTSALGSDVNSPVPFVQAKAKTEQHLRETGMNYTILAPNIFMGAWLGVIVGLAVQNQQPVSLVGSGEKKHTFIAEPDIAAFAMAAVDNPVAANQYIAIGGPEALSWLDIFKIAGHVLGHELEIKRIPPTEPIPFVPIHAGMAMSGLMAFSDTYETPIDMVETAKTYGVRLTTADEFLRGMFSAGKQ
ncbi:MAG: SDR family oxidoreductase [Chloroflexota bacterium]